MKDFTESVLNKYGSKAVLGLIAAVVVVWFLAHLNAEPGTNVSVFWGLVEYTKPMSSTVAQPSLPEKNQEKWDPSKKDVTAHKIIADTSDVSAHEIIAVTTVDRIYLNKRPRELLESVAHLTDLQGSLFEEKHYKGKWIRIKGPIHSIKGSSYYASLVFKVDGVITRIDMKDEFKDRVSHLQNGDVVTVDGMFKLMDRIGPDFDNGELVTVE